MEPRSQRADLPIRRSKKQRRASTVDKSVLALPAPRRIRDRDHVKSVAKQPCLVCGRRPADAHHLRFAQSRALGRKVSDEFTVPLCRGHHREVHRCGDEAAWWNKTGIDPSAAARVLWLKTHPLPSAIDSRHQNYQTNPIWKAAPHDLVPTDRGQSPQCAQEYRAENGSRKTGVALQCGPPRTYGGNSHWHAGRR